jgi:hypothetical protein
MPKFSGHITAKLLQDNFISMNTTMTKRICFDEMGGFDEQDRHAEDYELWLRISTRYTFYHIPEFISYYRVMEDQLSTDKDKRFDANFKIISRFIEKFPDALTLVQRRIGFGKFYLRKAVYERSVGRNAQACKDMLFSIASFPFCLGPWKLLCRIIISFFSGHKSRKH